MAENSFFAHLGKTLRQRIFYVILGVVILSQVIFLAERFAQYDALKVRRNHIARDIQLKTSFINSNDINVLTFQIQYYNGNGPQLWIENPEGDIVMGSPVKGFTLSERKQLGVPFVVHDNMRIWHAVLDWETGPKSSVELIVAPIYLKEGNFYYCYVYYAGRPAFFYSSFPFGLGILLITGAALSFAFAYYLAKPLRLLQTEVLAINNENLSDPLTVRNPVEVADVTCAINQLKSSLSQHIQSVHELMANVSHEMRSPLMRLTLAATFIEDGLNDARNRKQIKQKNGNARLQTDSRQNNDEYVDKQALAAKYLVYLKEDLTHMEKIVDTTLLSSKLDLQAEKDFVDLDFSRLCRDALGAQSMLAADKNLQMQVFVEDGVVMHADETLMRQVVFNLLDNAVKYSTQGSSISAGLKREDDRIVFCVENACPQLSEEKITRLFEPFYRAGKIGGTGIGLGLSLVKKIVTLHDGRVNAEHTGTALSVNVIFSVKQSTGEKMCGEKPCTQSASYQCLDRLCKQVPRDV